MAKEPHIQETGSLDRRALARARDKAAIRTLDTALRHGEDIFEPVSATEARRELSGSGIILLTDVHPEEQEEHVYQGQTPQDPAYWTHRYRQ